MNDNIIDPLNPLEPQRQDDSSLPYTTVGELRYLLHPDMIPNVDNLAIEDGRPVDSIFAEKQYRLLTESLYVSWKPEGHTFVALANVGLYCVSKQPALVPDVMLSLDVPVERDLSLRENLSYFVWVVGKVPDVVIEFVSDRRGDEEDYKKDEYERARIPYYVICDPRNRLDGGVLRTFALCGTVYQPIDESWLPGVGLGLTWWDGCYEQQPARWLRWCDREGVLIATGEERSEQERQRAEQERQRAKQERQRAKQERQRAKQAEQRAEEERQRAEQERQRAEKADQRAQQLAAQLRALGIEPNP